MATLAPHRQVGDLAGAKISLTQFCDAAQAQHWFDRLHAEIPWERHRLRLFGREIEAPRLSCWIGDAHARYIYSGTLFTPHAWTLGLHELRDLLFAQCGKSYNSVLCNLYRDGHDSMGWHSDDEPELGDAPVIASLSFGAVRRFQLRHRHDPDRRLALDLPSGSLLVMAGRTQQNYRHALPKTARQAGARINLTFRWVYPAG
ncbi:alpha-ketoglutarate-dependent dioxygenase AlkB family protein [Rudaea sp.]|uniref:alpha-ketoglutarate-dependent dioxygenase AlkB family protein n=1 Tax=Rudaea sp. TaxID=2136325 RepID=UPI0039C93547